MTRPPPPDRTVISGFRKSKLLADFRLFIASESLHILFGFGSSIIAVRYFGTEVYGAQQFILAMIAGWAIFNSVLDATASRFLGELPPSDQAPFAAGVVQAKGVCFVIIAGITYFSAAFFETSTLKAQELSQLLGMQSIVYCILVFGLLPILNTSLSRVVGIKTKFQYQATADSAEHISRFIWLVFSTVGLQLDGQAALLLVLKGWFAIGIFAIIGKSIVLGSHSRPFFTSFCMGVVSRHGISKVLSQKVRQYSGPMLASSLSGFIKEYLPLVVAASISNYENVAWFRIVQQIIRIGHQIIPAAMDSIRPGIIDAKNRDLSVFEAKYRILSFLYLGIAWLLGVFFIIFAGSLMSVWSIEANRTMVIVMTILSLDLIFGAALHIEYQIFMMGEKTWFLPLMSFLRQGVMALTMLVFSQRFGFTAIAASITFGTFAAWIGFTIYSALTNMRPRSHLWGTVAAAFFLACSIGLLGYLK